MKINKLILKNFSSFEGINEFDFQVTGERNIILIGGQNGAGKTSLFSAIKIALYGPLAFGYVGTNAHYTSKIKEFINTKTFHSEKVEAGVTINISVKVEREYLDYSISREWIYNKQKLEEKYSIKRDGKELDNQQSSYFNNYLLGIIPPDLFDFFMFDGEEVGNIFATSSYNSYVKNALFTMCGMDVYELIRKFTNGYVAKTDCAELDINGYENIKQTVEELQVEIQQLEIRKGELENELENNHIQLSELETAYKNAGGITTEEKEKLLKEYEEAEKIKQEMTLQLKNFVEGMMPFYIVGDFADKISEQLDLEEKGEIYYYVQNKIRKNQIKETLEKYGKVTDAAIDEVVAVLLDSFRPKGYSDNIEPIHDLSKEEIGRVNAIFSAIYDFDKNQIIKLIKDKQNASRTTVEINRLLKNSMAEDDVSLFKERENTLLKERDTRVRELHDIEVVLNEKNDNLTLLMQECNKKHQELINNAQNKHVYELSSGVSKIMEQLLVNKTESIRTKLEQLTVKNLHSIYRKDNLITHIEIEDDYQFSLFQNVTYYEGELLSLINNIGFDATEKSIGHKGIQELFEKYKTNSVAGLKKALIETSQMELVETYKKIELSRLSKGERQIFILALYWAIIMISGQDIPFIIDTPYARIDANHRKEISEKFFPNISKQVVILSTDEEINEEYYRIIKRFIAKEYLLSNDESINKTSIENRYFFEVKE